MLLAQSPLGEVVVAVVEADLPPRKLDRNGQDSHSPKSVINDPSLYSEFEPIWTMGHILWIQFQIQPMGLSEGKETDSQ
jgi:hypothetical protein